MHPLPATASASRTARWRVCLTHDEAPDGRLTRALAAAGFDVRPCPVLVERPAPDVELLRAAARGLDGYDWLVVASQRAVAALRAARAAPLPSALRTAAVGRRTAAALVAAGVSTPPVVADEAGADALWRALATESWAGRRVLVLTTPGGRRTLPERLSAAGAHVDEVDAYHMEVRPADAIAADWSAAAADAVVFASPRAVRALAAVTGADTLRLLLVVAVGSTTAAELARLGVPCRVAGDADFEAVAATVRAARDGGGPT